MEILEERLKRHEGEGGELYLDSLGNLTGGYGHHFYVGSRVPKEVATMFLRADIATAVSEYAKISSKRRSRLNVPRRRVIVEMIFNMGLGRVLGFVKMWDAIERGDFGEAAAQMLDSKWAEQVGKDPPSKRFPVGQRAWELAEIMREGVDLWEEGGERVSKQI